MKDRNDSTSRILEEHGKLRSELAELDRFLATAEGAADRKRWSEELADRMRRLRSLLEHHFANEEDLGLFDDIELRWPNAAAQCRQLLGEHGQALHDVDEIVAATRRTAAGGEPLSEIAGKTRTLMTLLEEHEERENDLLRVSLEGGPGAVD